MTKAVVTQNYRAPELLMDKEVTIVSQINWNANELYIGLQSFDRYVVCRLYPCGTYPEGAANKKQFDLACT